MANYLSPFSARQFVDANGNPYSGAKLFTYAVGSTTKVTTYKNEAGSSTHANPIVLNTLGEPADGSSVAYPIWQIGGAAVKYVLAPSGDTDPPASPISTWDNIDGINDTSASIDQWTTGPTPTYISTTSFSLAGDQSSTFHVGRRVKTTNSGGTVYGTIVASVYTTLTTITVVNDSGTLDSGITAVSYGTVSSSNSSIPGTIPHLVNFTAGIGPNYVQNIGITATVAAAALTIALKDKALADPASGSPAQASFRNRTETSGDYVVRQSTSASSIVVPSGATLGYVPILKTVTMTIASPCVVTDTGHGRLENDTVIFTTTGALPTGLTAGTVYYLRAVVTADVYRLSATPGGATIDTSGAQSGVHTASYAQKSSIYVYWCDDGSVRQIGVSRKATFEESRLHTTTAITTGSDSDNVLYTTSALTTAAVRLIGRVDITTGAVAGAWDNAATRIYVGSSHTTKGDVAAGYSRVTPNMCRLTSFTASTSLTRDAITEVIGPSGATGLILLLSPVARSNNATGDRQTLINVYSDSGATILIAQARALAREQAASVAGTLLLDVSSEFHVKCNAEGKVWLVFSDDTGNQGTAAYAILGYYD